MLQTHERMQERIEAAEAKVTEAASSAAAVKDLEAKIEKIYAELNGKVSEATASAAAAKVFLCVVACAQLSHSRLC